MLCRSRANGTIESAKEKTTEQNFQRISMTPPVSIVESYRSVLQSASYAALLDERKPPRRLDLRWLKDARRGLGVLCMHVPLVRASSSLVCQIWKSRLGKYGNLLEHLWKDSLVWSVHPKLYWMSFRHTHSLAYCFRSLCGLRLDLLLSCRVT